MSTTLLIYFLVWELTTVNYLLSNTFMVCMVVGAKGNCVKSPINNDVFYYTSNSQSFIQITLVVDG